MITYSEQTVEEIINKVNTIIGVPCINNFKTHFFQIFLRRNQGKVCGLIKADHFNIWVQDRLSTGIFYCVIEGTMTPRAKGVQVNIRSRMNPVGRLLLLALVIGLSCGLIFDIVIQEDNSWNLVLSRFLVGMILMPFMLFLPIATFLITSRSTRAYLTKTLGLTPVK